MSTSDVRRRRQQQRRRHRRRCGLWQMLQLQRRRQRLTDCMMVSIPSSTGPTEVQ